MEDGFTPLLHPLVGLGTSTESISIVPAAAAQTAQFSLSSVPPYSAGVDGPDQYNYGLGILAEIDYTFTQAGGTGVATPANDLHRLLTGIGLGSTLIGEERGQRENPGPSVGLFDERLGLRYEKIFPTRDVLPAANGAYTVNYRLFIPWMLMSAERPMDFCPWLGLYTEGGYLDLAGFVSTVFAGISPGNLISAVTVRAHVAYTPSPEAVIHVPTHFGRYTSPTGESVTLKGVGTPKGRHGIYRGPAGIFSAIWESNLHGLNGSDVVSVITAVQEKDWRQGRITRPGTKLALLRAMQGQTTPGSGNTTTIIHDGASWLSTIAAAPVVEMHNTLLGYAHVMPGRRSKLSKIRFSPEEPTIDYGFSAVPAGNHSHRLTEILKFNDDMKHQIAKKMGFAKGSYRFVAKTSEKQPASGISPVKRWFLPEKIVRV